MNCGMLGFPPSRTQPSLHCYTGERSQSGRTERSSALTLHSIPLSLSKGLARRCALVFHMRRGPHVVMHVS